MCGHRWKVLGSPPEYCEIVGSLDRVRDARSEPDRHDRQQMNRSAMLAQQGDKLIRARRRVLRQRRT